VIFGVSIGLQGIYAWVAPISEPPGGPVNKFLDASGNLQYTAGSLHVGGGTTGSLFGLYVEAGNVGIGTSNAYRKLTVAAPSGSTKPFMINTNDYNSVNTGSAFLVEFGAASGNTYSSLSAVSAGGTAWNNLILQPNGASGNVGIGTSNAYRKLTVAAPSGSTMPFMINTSDYNSANTGSAFLVEFGAASGNTYSSLSAVSAGGTARNNLILQPSGASGNVGIGTTVPSSNTKLEVVNNILNDRAARFVFNGTNDATVANGGAIVIQSSDRTAAAKGAIIFGAFDTLGGSRHGAAIESGKDGSAWVGAGESGDYPGYLSFWTRQPGAGNYEVERMHITSTGNVGIGTPAPGVKLDVNGTARINNVLYFAGSPAALAPNWFELGYNNGTTGTGIDFHGGSSLTDYTARIYRLAGDNGEFQIVNAGAGPLNFYTNNASPRMTILANGNVGIGTNAPGTAKTYVYNDGSNVGLYVGNGTPFGQSQIEISSPSSATHIWVVEGGIPVFNVLGGGTVGTAGNITAGGNVCSSGGAKCLNEAYDTAYSAYTIAMQAHERINWIMEHWPSDRNLKKDIISIQDSLGKLKMINGVYFDWKNPDPTRLMPEGRQVGVIAQDVQKVLPEAVSKPEGKDYLAVNYISLIPLVIEGVKELKSDFDERSKDITKLYEMQKNTNLEIDNIKGEVVKNTGSISELKRQYSELLERVKKLEREK
jgi:hypothetical protein